RHAAAARPQLARHDGANAWEALGLVGAGDAHVLAGEHTMPAREVVAGVVVQRADHGKFVGDLRLPGKQGRDVKAGYAGADRPPDAAVLLGGIGLHIIKVHVAGTAVEPEHNYRRVAL